MITLEDEMKSSLKDKIELENPDKAELKALFGNFGTIRFMMQRLKNFCLVEWSSNGVKVSTKTSMIETKTVITAKYQCENRDQSNLNALFVVLGLPGF